MSTHLILAGVALIALTATPSVAQTVKADPKNRHFAYFLPRANVGGQVTQRIVSCPVADTKDPSKPKGLAINTYIALGSEQFADPKAMFTVDARAGFLSKRSTKLVLRPDGTLETFNVTSEGQGAELVGSLITVAATVATWGTAAAPVALAGAGMMQPQGVEKDDKAKPKPKLLKIRCAKPIVAALDRLGKVREDITRLEVRIVDGKASTSDTALLQLRRDEEVELVAGLTLKAGKGVRFDPDRDSFSLGRDKSPPLLSNVTAAPKYEDWFELLADDGSYVPATAADVARYFPNLPGKDGFVGTLAVDQPLYAVLAGQPTPDTKQAQRFVYYRRPVPVTLSVKPCSGPAAGTSCKPVDAPGAGMAKSAVFRLPQLSGLYAFSIGEGGIFGTREAAVKLDATGAPIALEYGSGSGGAKIAGVVDKGLAGATLMRDAQTAANKRRIEAITAERELAALLAPASTPTTE